MRHLVLPRPWKDRIKLLTQSDPILVEMDRRRRELRSQLSRLQDLYVKRDVTAEEYERSQRLIKRKLMDLELPLGQNDQRVGMWLEDFGGLWTRFNREEKKEMIRKVVKAVYVKNGLLDRVELYPPFKLLSAGQRASETDTTA